MPTGKSAASPNGMVNFHVRIDNLFPRKVPAEGEADLLPDGEGGEDEMANIQPGTPRGGQVSQLISWQPHLLQLHNLSSDIPLGKQTAKEVHVSTIFCYQMQIRAEDPYHFNAVPDPIFHLKVYSSRLNWEERLGSFDPL